MATVRHTGCGFSVPAGLRHAAFTENIYKELKPISVSHGRATATLSAGRGRACCLLNSV